MPGPRLKKSWGGGGDEGYESQQKERLFSLPSKGGWEGSFIRGERGKRVLRSRRNGIKKSSLHERYLLRQVAHKEI